MRFNISKQNCILENSLFDYFITYIILTTVLFLTFIAKLAEDLFGKIPSLPGCSFFPRNLLLVMKIYLASEQRIALKYCIKTAGIVVPVAKLGTFFLPLMATLPLALTSQWQQRYALQSSPLPLEISPLEVTLLWHQRHNSDTTLMWLAETIQQLVSD